MDIYTNEAPVCTTLGCGQVLTRGDKESFGVRKHPIERPQEVKYVSKLGGETKPHIEELAVGEMMNTQQVEAAIETKGVNRIKLAINTERKTKVSTPSLPSSSSEAIGDDIFADLPQEYAAVFNDQEKRAINNLWLSVSLEKVSKQETRVVGPNIKSSVPSGASEGSFMFYVTPRESVMTSREDLPMATGVYVPGGALSDPADIQCCIIQKENIKQYPLQECQVGPITFTPHGEQFHRPLAVLVALPDEIFRDDQQYDYIVHYSNDPTENTTDVTNDIDWQDVTSFQEQHVSGVVLPKYRMAFLLMSHFCKICILKRCSTANIELLAHWDNRGPSVRITCLMYLTTSLDNHREHYMNAKEPIKHQERWEHKMSVRRTNKDNVKVTVNNSSSGWMQMSPKMQEIEHIILWEYSFPMKEFVFKTNGMQSSFHCNFHAQHGSSLVDVHIELFRPSEVNTQDSSIIPPEPNPNIAMLMDAIERKLIENRPELTKRIIPDDLWDYLLSYHVITPVTKARIKKDRVEKDQVGELLDHVEKRPFTDYVNFCVALIETNQAHVVRRWLWEKEWTSMIDEHQAIFQKVDLGTLISAKVEEQPSFVIEGVFNPRTGEQNTEILTTSQSAGAQEGHKESFTFFNRDQLQCSSGIDKNVSITRQQREMYIKGMKSEDLRLPDVGSFSLIKSRPWDLNSAKEYSICAALTDDYASSLADEDRTAINTLWLKVSDTHNAKRRKLNIEVPNQGSGTCSDQFAVSNQAASLISGHLAMEMGVYVPVDSILESNCQKFHILHESNILTRISFLPGDLSIGPISFTPHGIQFNKSLVVLIALPDDLFADEDDHDYIVRYNKSATQNANEWENVTSFRPNEVSGVVIPQFRAAVIFMPHFCDLEVCKCSRDVAIEIHGFLDIRGPSVRVNCVAYRPQSAEEHPKSYQRATQNIRPGGFKEVHYMAISNNDPSDVIVRLSNIAANWTTKEYSLQKPLQHRLIWNESFATLSFFFTTDSSPTQFGCNLEAHSIDGSISLYIDVHDEAADAHRRNNTETVLTKEEWKNKISGNGPRLIENIHPDQLWVHLQAKNVINTMEKNKIKNNSTREEQVAQLLERIQQCDNTAFINFCISLIDTNQKHIVKGYLWERDWNKNLDDPGKKMFDQIYATKIEEHQ